MSSNYGKQLKPKNVLGVGLKTYKPQPPMPLGSLPFPVFKGQNPWNDNPQTRKLMKQHSDFQKWRKGEDPRADSGVMQGQQDMKAATAGMGAMVKPSS